MHWQRNPTVIPANALLYADISFEAKYGVYPLLPLRARLRVLDAGQVQTLLDYENAHESRPAVITMFERRLTKLSEGN